MKCDRLRHARTTTATPKLRAESTWRAASLVLCSSSSCSMMYARRQTKHGDPGCFTCKHTPCCSVRVSSAVQRGLLWAAERGSCPCRPLIETSSCSSSSGHQQQCSALVASNLFLPVHPLQACYLMTGLLTALAHHWSLPYMFYVLLAVPIVWCLCDTSIIRREATREQNAEFLSR